MTAAFITAGCTKTDDPDNNGGGHYEGNYEYVDLGLPSGTLWATFNVGANSPEGYGDYFAWGETRPKTTYDWSTYKYCKGGENQLTKYCNNPSYGYNSFTDNLTTLQPNDDAATVKWGRGWRMPTQEEWQELLANTTGTLIHQDDRVGALFTAANGNTLYLPAAGCRNGSSLNCAGTHGYYWLSSLYTDSCYPNGACGGLFGKFAHDYFDNRSYGYSVRAVRSSPQN